MNKDEELKLKIALTHLPNVGSVLARNLVGFTGGVEAVFKQRKSHLIKIPGIGSKTADQIIQKASFEKAEKELEFIEKHNIRVLFYLDDDYPVRLKHIKDAPTLLYYKGNADLNSLRILAIVGTRKPSTYGITQCQKLVDEMKNLNVLILSGLAYGIDVIAHRKALESGLATVCVMGSGLDRIYPAVHRKTATEMIENGGLITEFTSGTKPDRENFPMRNRIIAGMCDALVVVESDQRGGSMITAELANSYHKDVFAIPGRIGDRYSRGCNLLIKSNRAALIDGAEDLAKIMHWSPEVPSLANTQRALFAELTDKEKQVFESIPHDIPVNIDRLYKELLMSASELAGLLLSLEFKGLIKALPGKLYIRV